MVAPALASTGLFGLCILMALTLDDDTSDDFDEEESLRSECEFGRQQDVARCNRIKTARGREACFASANERYAACITRQPLPPLVTWVK